MRVDVLIFGGGVAGLWLLDELTRRSRRAVLLEAAALGHGQTAAAQGIIHGGLKYTLQGLLTGAAAQIREMPLLWRECLAGRRQPDLSGTRIRADHCYLWRTDSVASRLGMLGARFGLRVMPRTLDVADRPAILAGCPGVVARLDEQVISTTSLVSALARRHHGRILKVPRPGAWEFALEAPGRVGTVSLSDASRGAVIDFRPRFVVLTAGSGNAELRRRFGLDPQAMQLRPLHMVLLRGRLPHLNGHCVDGAKTRVTVTSDTDARGRTVWQVGGQIAEDGVRLDPLALIQHARDELAATIPGIDLTDVEWGTYRIDRAERTTASGVRPESAQILSEGNILTAWPTKLALAPRLAEEIADHVCGDSTRAEASGPAEFAPDWPRPSVALPPWETCHTWMRLTVPGRRVA